MIPLLIIGFARLQNIAEMIEEYRSTDREIYLFVDKAENEFRSENDELIEFAISLVKKSWIKLKISERNLGVGRAVPSAIDWVFESETSVIVLEDDCYLAAPHLKYFDRTISFLSEERVMVCGTTPDTRKSDLKLDTIIPVKYPLIWGWATNINSWQRLRRIYDLSTRSALKEILLNGGSRQILSIAFFLSALIRVRRGRNFSWDSEIAFIMLARNYKSLVPNLSIVWNRGADKFAHHTINGNEVRYGSHPNPEIQISERINLNSEIHEIKIVEELIESEIYHLKFRNVLSPIKAILGQ